MKTYLIILVIIIPFAPISAQNLISNASFEEFDSTFLLPGPYYLNQSFGIYYDWESINTADFYYTENYWIFNNMPQNLFDSLSTNVYVGADSCFLCVPTNNFGYRPTRTGNGYTGVRAYSGAQGHNYKEYIKTQFTEPLIQDRIYQISFYTCPSIQNPFFLNSLGAYISSSEIYYNEVYDNSLPAQILSENTISNTTEWTEVKGLYRANGGENFITIGNFDTETVINDPFFNVYLNCIYYFLEDVSVFPYSNRLDTSICKGDTIILSPSRQDNSNCLWQDNSTDTLLYALEEGIYWVKQSYYWPETSTTVIQYDTFNISFKPQLEPTDLGNDTSLCDGESLILTATNPNAYYEWSNGSNSNQYITNQSELIWLKEFSECETIIDSIQIHLIPPLSPINLGNDTVICYSDSLVLSTANLNASYEWSNGSNANHYIANHEGSIWLREYNHCYSVSDTIEINIIQPLFLDLGKDTTFCIGETYQINPIVNSYDIEYLWSDSTKNEMLTVKSHGIYWLEIKNQCEIITDTIKLGYIDKLSLNLGADTIICYNGSHTLKINNPNAVDILWQDNSKGNTYEADNAGLYYASISNQCESVSDSIMVSVYPRLKLNLGEDILLCEDDTIGFEMLIDVSNANAKYLWQDGTQNSTYNINDFGQYYVEVSSGCETLSDTLLVRYLCECNLLTPNSFTPNKDLHNDLFLTKQNCDFYRFHLQIFNRWGELIFETYNPKEGWNGSYKGQASSIGVYSYKINCQFRENMKIKRLIGKVLLAQ